MSVMLTSSQEGEAGEYAAAAELAARGWMVDRPYDRRSREIDWFAHSPSGARTIAVNVKARASGDFHLATS